MRPPQSGFVQVGIPKAICVGAHSSVGLLLYDAQTGTNSRLLLRRSFVAGAKPEYRHFRAGTRPSAGKPARLRQAISVTMKLLSCRPPAVLAPIKELWE